MDEISGHDDFIRVADEEDLQRHGQLTRWVHDHDLLVYRYEGRVRVLSNICPHFGGPVGHHQLRNGEFTCLWHNFRFRAADGRGVCHPSLRLREYTVRREDGGIWVRLVEDDDGRAD